MHDETFYFVLNNKRSDELFDHEFYYDIFEDQKLENKSSFEQFYNKMRCLIY